MDVTSKRVVSISAVSIGVRWVLPFFIVMLGVLSAVYFMPYIQSCGQFCVDQHVGTLNGTIYSPLRYRVLMPFLVDRLFPEPLTAYALAHALVLPALYLVLFQWLKQHATKLLAVMGVVLLALFMPLFFQIYAISAYAPVELLLLCLVLMAQRNRALVLILVIIGGFNRETTPLLMIGGIAALNFDALRRGDRRLWAWMIVYGAAFAAVYAGLRLTLGAAPDMVPVEAAWRGNTGGGWHTQTAILNNAMLAGLWILAAVGWQDAPKDLKRLALVSLPYLGLLAIFAFWTEVRLLMPLWALVIPLSLRGLARLTR